MTQLSPDTSIYSKAIARLRTLDLKYKNDDISSPEDYMASIVDIVNSVYLETHKPSLAYDFIEDGEPPSSKSMTFFWESFENDVNIVQSQINYLRAHAVSSYNSLTNSLKRSSNENARVRGKLNSLSLYSDSISNKERIFGDFFTNYDHIDLNKSDIDIYNTGSIVLKSQSSVINLLSSSVPSVHPFSNGIPGNNFEVDYSPDLSILNVDEFDSIVFKHESTNYNDLNSLIDNDPLTRFEYEVYQVSDQDRQRAKNFGFEINKLNGSAIDWASGPLQINNENLNYLRLLLDFDLGSNQKASIATLTPHKVSEGSTHPIKVSRVLVSQDGSNWTRVSRKPVWIGNDINLTGTSASDEIVIGTAFWSFQEQYIRYARFEIEQAVPLRGVPIGHIYFEGIEEVDSDGNIISNGERIDQPSPSVANVAEYTNPSLVDNVVKKREVFLGERWAIGIKDMALATTNYDQSSTLVSKSFKVDGVIDKVAIEADYDIPADFNDAEGQWVEFFVSPNDGADWFQISNIQDDFYSIPEIISFNNPIPKEFREVNVAYYNVKEVVNSITVKIVLRRPADLVSSTPVVRSYKLKVLKR